MQFTAIVHGGVQLFGPESMPASNGLLPSFDTDGNFSAWVAAGSHAEGDAHSGGTSGGIVYVDASGNIATDGPTVDASSNLTTTGRIVTDSGSTPSTGGESLQIEGTTATLAEFYRRGGGTNSTVVFRGGSSFCHVGVNSTGFAIGAASNLSTNWFHINSSTGYVSSGPITATASAITDTPLTVAGTAGQTADLAAIGDVTVDASSNVTSTGRFTSSGFRTSTTHYDPTRIWTNSLSYYISAAISGQTDHKIKMAQWDAAQSLYRMEIQAGDAVTYFDAPAGVEFTGSLEVSGDINFSAANPSLQRQGVDYVSLSSGLVNLGQNAQSTYLGSGAFGHYGKSWISSPSNGVMSVFAWDGSTLAEVDVGILNATAQAITDTPLSVAGAVGQTAALATFGSGARVTAAEEFSNPGSAAGSESFGAGASCTAADGLAVGPDASTVGVEATAVGADSVAHPYATSVGSLARCTAGSNWNASKTAVGYGTYADHTHTIVLGAISASTASYQFVAGSYAAIMKDVYFGTGVAYATPDATTIHGTGGSGTDIAGADISIAGGIGTGTGAGGDIVFKTAAAGSTGSTANTLTTAMTIDGSTGRATFGERIIVDRIGIGTTGIAGSFKTEGDSKTSWHDGSDEIWMFASAGHAIKSDAYLGWSDGSANAGTVDTRLYRDSAGVLSLRAGATTLGELQAGILNAIAPAITDTPLIVNGSVGHTADLILANDGSNDVFQVSAAGSGKLAGNLMLGRYASTAQAVVNTSASSSNTSGTQHQIGLNIGGGMYHGIRLNTAGSLCLDSYSGGWSETFSISTTGDLEFSGNLTISSPDIPASASATGTAGTISWDSDYIYICTATDTWKRVAISTW